jgi:tetratricopeptide (TPR) repeat protein
MRPLRGIFLAAAVSFACAMAPGCKDRSAEDAAARSRGELLCLEKKFDEAIPVLKQYLANHPDDSGSHFYLGVCFLACKKPWLVIAQGEIETALYLFNKQGKKSSIERFADVYFEQRCYIESAKVYLRQFDILLELQVAPEELEPYIDKVAELNDKARPLNSSLQDIRDLDNNIALMREYVKTVKKNGVGPPKRAPEKRLPATSSPGEMMAKSH